MNRETILATQTAASLAAPLCCTVRGCRQLLAIMDGGLRCAHGHHFDRGREGYYSLLQPQDRKSLRPGDCDDAVLARRRWIDRGHGDGFVKLLRAMIQQHLPVMIDGKAPFVPRRVLDLGSGEGSIGYSVVDASTDVYCGIDLAKKAVRMAAKRFPDGTWVWCNSDIYVPVANNSIDIVMSLFGRRPAAEISRVVADGGLCIVAVPGPDDLIQLRGHVQQRADRRSRWETIVEQMSAAGLKCMEHRRWADTVHVDPDAIADAMAMTYRGARRSERERLEMAPAMSVTVSADVLILQPQPR